MVVVPEAEAPTAGFRARFLERSVARRLPAHITLLYPFADADAVDGGLLATLGSLYAGAEPFPFELARVDAFEAHVWLAPEPKERFIELIRLTWERFPDSRPYGAAVADSEPVPHLTVGEGVDVEALRAEAERALGPALPIACTADSVTLLEEQPDGTWASRASFPLGAR